MEIEAIPAKDLLIQASVDNDVKKIKDLLKLCAKVGQPLDINAHEEGGHSALTSAAFSGSFEAVQCLVENDADVNYGLKSQNPEDDYEIIRTTPLWYAASQGHIEMVAYLIQHGAKLDFQDVFFGMTPLMKTVDENVVDLLLKAGASLDPVDRQGHTALSRAELSKNLSLVKQIRVEKWKRRLGIRTISNFLEKKGFLSPSSQSSQLLPAENDQKIIQN
jgi:ankyrin repeat protein